MSDSELAASTWPSLAYETLPWQTDSSAPASRNALRRHQGPYRAAVVPQIAGARVVLPAETAASAEEAAAEVARFDAELGYEIAPFAAVLLRSESAASSKIENLTASARAIAEAELADHGTRNASLIVANERAMSAAIALAERIDDEAILEMHAALLERAAPEIAGRWRDEQVWIGGSHVGPHHAMFVPPRAQRVPPAISDLVAFIDRDDIAVLPQAALAHAQFETIHPFPDGNGRTGRALVHAQLRHKGLTRNVTVPVSAGLLSDVDSYFEALTRYREGDATAIVDAFSEAALKAVANGRELVTELRSIRRDWEERIHVRRGAITWRIADLLVRHPVINAAFVASETGIAPQNVYRSLQPILDAGVIVVFTDSKRNQLWRAPEVLQALDRFAARAGRRRSG